MTKTAAASFSALTAARTPARVGDILPDLGPDEDAQNA